MYFYACLVSFSDDVVFESDRAELPSGFSFEFFQLFVQRLFSLRDLLGFTNVDRFMDQGKPFIA